MRGLGKNFTAGRRCKCVDTFPGASAGAVGWMAGAGGTLSVAMRGAADLREPRAFIWGNPVFVCSCSAKGGESGCVECGVKLLCLVVLVRFTWESA